MLLVHSLPLSLSAAVREQLPPAVYKYLYSRSVGKRQIPRGS
jgi:hypothetical protein